MNISDEFKMPGKNYRSIPFWAWNCKLNKQLMKQQIDCFEEMGFGGFLMHPRYGLDTEYLGKEFMEHVKFCVEYAKSKNMQAWIYDEDRWPSGSAGGMVTRNPDYVRRDLRFMRELPDKYERMLGCYDIVFDESGRMLEYKQINSKEKAEGQKWYACILMCDTVNGRDNGNGPNDMLNENATKEFLRLTHERYYSAVGGDFGGTVPAFFTDEPRFGWVLTVKENGDMGQFPWIDDIQSEIYEKDHIDISAHLPEVFFDTCNDENRIVRYTVLNYLTDKHIWAFSKKYSEWCREHHIAYSGHILFEDNLKLQTMVTGETMRSYPEFDIPGVDVLEDKILFTTLKQLQSVKRQYGKKHTLSELYGVTNWDFDFKGFKFQGDWQAALGIDIRVPHLSWMSMKGGAKRDFPPSIFYQSPWYKEFANLEDYFSRINVFMQNSFSAPKLAVIHPVEGFWLHYGADETNSAIRAELDNTFEGLCSTLIKNNIDFDYISEDLLARQECRQTSSVFKMGNMVYDIVIVCGCVGLRGTTVRAIQDFAFAGGKVILIGDAPRYIDAQLETIPNTLSAGWKHIANEKNEIINALQEIIDVSIVLFDGTVTEKYMHAMNSDTENPENKRLFICHSEKTTKSDDVIITIEGEFNAMRYDAETGEVREIEYEVCSGKTIIRYRIHPYDSLLVYLSKDEVKTCVDNKCERVSCDSCERVKLCGSDASYHLEEPNVLLLDTAQYSLDDAPFEDEEEILKIDGMLRKKIGLTERTNNDIQPWAQEKENPTHIVTLKFAIESKIETKVVFASENGCKSEISFNGIKAENQELGCYIDMAIRKTAVGTVKQGRNEILVKIPFGKDDYIENMYLLGNFGVELEDSTNNVCKRPLRKRIIRLPELIEYRDVTGIGLPFYGGNIVYSNKVYMKRSGNLEIFVSDYYGACIRMYVDGNDIGLIYKPPYSIRTNILKEGEHTVEIKLYGNRYNTFAALHNICEGKCLASPEAWQCSEDKFSYSYNTKSYGLLHVPEFYAIYM